MRSLHAVEWKPRSVENGSGVGSERIGQYSVAALLERGNENNQQPVEQGEDSDLSVEIDGRNENLV